MVSGTCEAPLPTFPIADIWAEGGRRGGGGGAEGGEGGAEGGGT